MFKMGPLPAVRTTKRVTFRSQLPLRFRGRRGEAPLPPPALSPPPSAPTPPVTATDQTQRSASANQAPTRTRKPACARINNGHLPPPPPKHTHLATSADSFVARGPRSRSPPSLARYGSRNHSPCCSTFPPLHLFLLPLVAGVMHLPVMVQVR
jgi:hypothetical protein